MNQYKIQSILIPKKIYSKTEARQWIHNNYKNKGVDETDKYFRYRQLNPKYLESKGYTKFRNKLLDNGIYLVLAYRK